MTELERGQELNGHSADMIWAAFLFFITVTRHHTMELNISIEEHMLFHTS